VKHPPPLPQIEGQHHHINTMVLWDNTTKLTTKSTYNAIADEHCLFTKGPKFKKAFLRVSTTNEYHAGLKPIVSHNPISPPVKGNTLQLTSLGELGGGRTSPPPPTSFERAFSPDVSMEEFKSLVHEHSNKVMPGPMFSVTSR